MGVGATRSDNDIVDEIPAASWITPIAVALILFLGALGTPAAAQDRQTVVWAFQEAPPTFLTTGSDIGAGYGDRTYRYFLDRMPEFQHRQENLPIARVWEAIAQGDGVCYGFARKTPEREKYAVFSRQVYWLQSHRLIIRKSDLPRFDRFIAGKAVELSALVAEPRLSGGVLIGRTYGAAIDDIIAKHRAKDVIEGMDRGQRHRPGNDGCRSFQILQ